MKTMLAAVLLALVAYGLAQTVDIAALGRKCVPEAPLSTLNAIVRVESGGNQSAMQIDFPKTLLKRWHLPAGTVALKRQPANAQEALAWLRYFQTYGIYVDLGLMQVSSYEAKRRKIDPESLLDPCTNLRAGWQISRRRIPNRGRHLRPRPDGLATRALALQHRRHRTWL